MDNACVIGYGIVGQATAKVFGIEKHYDIDPERSNISLEEASKCKFIFICLPTEILVNGTYKTAAIAEVIQEVEKFNHSPIYIIRSTVFPGFASNVREALHINRIVSNPEFLNEDTAEQDMKSSAFILLGGDSDTVKEVQGYYQARLKGSPIITTDNVTAEMAKLTMNAFFATKVIFANQAYDACLKFGANYETVKKVLESHPYGPKNHFTIFHKGYRGFGGRCLPKDTQAYAYYTESDLIKKVIEINNKLKEENELQGQK